MINQMLIDTKRFCSNFFDSKKLTEKERQQWTKEFVLCITDEAHEILREVNWKHHKSSEINVSKHQLLVEMIDVLKFWAALAHVWQFNFNDIQQAYFEKTAIVEHKHEQSIKPTPKGPTIVIDVDDVIAKFRDPYYDYCRMKNIVFERNHPFFYFPPNTDLKTYTIESLLLEWINEHRGYRHLPVVEGAKLALNKLTNKYDANIVLLTARPQLEIVKHDTLYWLAINKISYNSLVFSEEKENCECIDNAHIVIEDRQKHAAAYAERGKHVILLNYPHNKTIKHPLVHRVNNWVEALQKIEELKDVVN